MKNDFIKKAMKRYSIVLSLLIVAVFAVSSLGVAMESSSSEVIHSEAGDSGTLTRALLWSALIGVSETLGETDNVIVEEDTTSSDGPPQDANDVLNPPLPPGGLLDAYLDDGLPFPYNKLQTDSRFGPDPDYYKVFNLTVAYGGVSTVTLTWNPLDFGATEYAYVNLTDASYVFLADMKTASSYVFSIAYVPANFHIVCEKPTPPDVGAISIDTPTGIIPKGQAVTPQVTVENFKPDDAINCPVNLQISPDGYDQTVTVTIPAYSTLAVSFPSWTPTATGTETLTACTQMPNDEYQPNNCTSGTVDVQTVDVGVSALNDPCGTVYIEPNAVSVDVTNYNTVIDATGIPVHVVIDLNGTAGVYDQYMYVSVDALQTETVIFPDWTPGEPGPYTVTACTEFPEDPNSANNCSTCSGTVPAATHDVGFTSVDSPTGSIPPIPVAVQGTVTNFGTGAADEVDVPCYATIHQLIPNDLTEGFESGIPGDWIQVQHSGTGWWQQEFYSGPTTYDPPGTGLAWAGCDSDTYTTTTYDVSLFTPSLDMSAASSVGLSFVHEFEDFAGCGDFRVAVYSGGYAPGNQEQVLISGTADDDDLPNNQVYTLYPGTYADPSDVYIEWWYSTGGGTYCWSYGIDDVVITGVGATEILDFSGYTEVDVDVGMTASAYFGMWTPSVPNYDYKVRMWTELESDFNNSNNMTSSVVNVFGGDVGVIDILSPFGSASRGITVYAYNAYDPTYVVPEGPIWYDTDTPGTITPLAPTSSMDFLAAGCWADGVWYGSQYGNGALYTIDTGTGAMTYLGATGVGLNGFTYDDSLGQFFGVGGGNFYSVDVTTQTATYIGAHGAGMTIISLVSDGSGNLFGHSVSFSTTDNLYSFDPGTGAATLVGNTGVNFLYAQDAEIDKGTGIMWVSGYTQYKAGSGGIVDGLSPDNEGRPGALFTIDTSTGIATSQGAFQGGMEVSADAIESAGGGGGGVNCPGTYQVRGLVQNFETGSAAYNVDVYAEIPEISYSEMVSLASIAAGANVTVTFPSVYLDSGDYTVTMYTVMAGDTNPANDDKTVYGHVAEPPVADANGPYYADEDNAWTVIIDGSGSYHPDGINLTYHWDFGDGNTDTTTDPFVTHTYDPPEEEDTMYTVTLIVEDDECHLTDMDTAIVYVAGYQDPPIVDLNYPTGGESVSGTITIDWYATDDSNVEDVYLYYQDCDDDCCTWHKIAGPIENTGSYSWNTGSLSDGQYKLMIVVVDDEGNPTSVTSGCFTVGNGYSGTRVSAVNAEEDFVRDGDTVTIVAGITGGRALYTNDITADLSALGKGTAVVADSYDGFTATWTVSNIMCSPSDGELTITVFAGTESGTGTVVADNTKPSVTIAKPTNGLYLFNRKFFPMSRTVIIGGLTIEVESEDSSGIELTEFLVDGQLVHVTLDSQWYMNTKFMGRHTLEIRVHDNAGNTHTETVAFSGYNLFGTE